MRHSMLYRAATAIDTARHNYLHPPPHPEVLEALVRGRDRATALLGQAIKSLEGRLAEYDVEPREDEEIGLALPVSPDVFIVHGHERACENGSRPLD